MNRWSTWAFGLVALSCCPEPEGCLESPGTLRLRVDASQETDSSCGFIDLAPGSVVTFASVGEYHPSTAERQCAECPLQEVLPIGEFEGWSEVERRDTPPDRGRIVSGFNARVDGCDAVVELAFGPIDGVDGGSNYRLFRQIEWGGRCATHAGSCYDEFLMTELPDEE